MIIAGIDPGHTGAVAVVTHLGHCEAIDMPIINLFNTTMVDGYILANFLRTRDVDFCVIEHAQAMPKQGVTSMFTYGRAFGSIIGVVQSLNIAFTLVKPAMWKKQVGLIKAKKSDSVALAKRCFPLTGFPRVKDHNQAEAALMAYWWRNHPLRAVEGLAVAA